MEKLNILIFEDDAAEIEILQQILSAEYNISSIAKNYDEGVVALKTQVPDIAILDIYMGGKREGIRFAAYIQNRYNFPILFLTNSKDKLSFTEAKKLNPYNYLLKPVSSQSLKFAIELAFEKYTNQLGELSARAEGILQLADKLLIKKGNLLIKITVNDIFYIESDDKYCFVHTNSQRFLVQKSLRSFSETLPENFINLHRKYITNTDHIQSVFPSDYSITLKNETVLPVSQRYRKKLLDLFTIIK